MTATNTMQLEFGIFLKTVMYPWLAWNAVICSDLIHYLCLLALVDEPPYLSLLWLFFFFSFSGSCCVQFGWVSNRQRSSRLSLRGETMAGVCRSHPAGYPEQARVLKLADTSVWCHPPPLTFLPLPGKWMLSRKRGQIWVKTSDENPSFPRLQL